jgi:Peroxisomal biogenesis factor 11 (PEX11)
MTALDATRAELGLVVLYLNKAEARDKICRAIQYGSKFISNGQPGTAKTVDGTTTLARKVFRLLKVFICVIFLFFFPAVSIIVLLVMAG